MSNALKSLITIATFAAVVAVDITAAIAWVTVNDVNLADMSPAESASLASGVRWFGAVSLVTVLGVAGWCASRPAPVVSERGGRGSGGVLLGGVVLAVAAVMVAALGKADGGVAAPPAPTSTTVPTQPESRPPTTFPPPSAVPNIPSAAFAQAGEVPVDTPGSPPWRMAAIVVLFLSAAGLVLVVTR